MRTTVFVAIAIVTLSFCLSAQAVTNEHETFNTNAFDLTGWYLADGTGLSDFTGDGAYRLTLGSGEYKSTVGRVIGTGSFEAVINLRSVNLDQTDQVFTWSIVDEYNVNELHVILENQSMTPFLRVSVVKSGVQTTDSMYISPSWTATTLGVSWDETAKVWRVFYDLDTTAGDPATTEHQFSPISGYPIGSIATRYMEFSVSRADTAYTPVAELDDYSLVPSGPTATPTNVIPPSITATFSPTRTPSSTPTPTFTPTPTPTDAWDGSQQVYVSEQTGNDASGTGTQANPWASISKALAAVTGTASKPVIVHVAEGTYSGPVYMEQHVSLLGGYKSDIPNRWSRDPWQYRTIINGGLHCVVGADNAVLNGFFIMGGFGSGVAYPNNVGGGVLCLGTSPTISGNVICKNNTFDKGGGIYLENSSAKVKDNVITGNATMVDSSMGAGIFCGPGTDDAVVEGNLIVSNGDSVVSSVKRMGIGVACEGSNATFERNYIVGNHVAIDTPTPVVPQIGAGVFVAGQSQPKFISNVIVGNTINGIGCKGSGVCVVEGPTTSHGGWFLNNIIADNASIIDTQSAAFEIGSASPILANNIFQANANTAIKELDNLAKPALLYNNLFYNNPLGMYGIYNSITLSTVTGVNALTFAQSNIEENASFDGVYFGVSDAFIDDETYFLCTLVDSDATWKPHSLNKHVIKMPGLTSQGQDYWDFNHRQFLIVDNTANTITFWGNLSLQSVKTRYMIINPHIQKTSPCVDAGVNLILDTTDKDIDEEPRIMGGLGSSGTLKVDIGPDEIVPSVVRKVQTVVRSNGGLIVADQKSKYNKVALSIPPQINPPPEGPAGLAANVDISMSQPDADLGFNTTIEFGPSGTAFDPPATLQLEYHPDDIPAGRSVDALHVLEWKNNEWIDLGQPEIDPLARTAQIEIDSFSTYALGILLPGGPLYISGSTLIDNSPSVSGLWVTLINNGYGTVYDVTATLTEVAQASKTYTDIASRGTEDVLREFRWGSNFYIPPGRKGGLSSGFRFLITDNTLPPYFRLSNVYFYGAPPAGEAETAPPVGLNILADVDFFPDQALVDGQNVNIGLAGGSVEPTANGIYTKHKLTIPAGALSSAHVFSVTHPGEEFIPASIAITPKEVEFALACTLQMEYKSDDVPNAPFGETPEDKMAIHMWNGTDWELLPGSQTLDKVNKTVTASITTTGAEGIFGVLTDIVPPENPTDLIASTDAGSLELRWTPPVDRHGDLAGQVIYVSEDGGATWDTGTSLGTATNRSLRSVSPDKEYTYRISSVDGRGNESEGVFVSATLGAPAFDGIQSLELVPGSGDSEQIVASWNLATPVTIGAPVTYNGYISELSLLQDFDSPSFSTSSLSYDLTSLLIPGRTYYVVVRAESESVEDGNIEELSIQVPERTNSTGIDTIYWDLK